jgi:type I restriction enzyme R subunit
VDARNIRNIVLMRPINTMIEFKQIIGRGTRLYDGKDYFTIYDFVKAHLISAIRNGTASRLDPEPCPKCGQRPCVCVVKPPEPCARCAAKARANVPKNRARSLRPASLRLLQKTKKAKVKLADGKARNIQHMMCTTFWHPDGTPMSAQQFMEMLFGKLPDFFQSEAELRAIMERAGHAGQAVARAWPRKALATTNWRRCRRSLMPRRATCSTCWLMWPTPCRRPWEQNTHARILTI